MTSFLPSASISTGLPHAFDVSNPTTSYANSYPAAPAPPPSAHSDSMSPTSPTAADTPTSRLAAEEDKRRRNTAASARFRVKKKQREQALERQAKDLADKTKALEDKVVKLETENEWLRGLVVERDGRDRLDEGVEGWRRKHREEKGKEKEKAPETAEV